jgi:hypothetical protein
MSERILERADGPVGAGGARAHRTPTPDRRDRIGSVHR